MRIPFERMKLARERKAVAQKGSAVEFFICLAQLVWDAAGHQSFGDPAHQEVFLDAAAT
jgi:hypothetical protein